MVRSLSQAGPRASADDSREPPAERGPRSRFRPRRIDDPAGGGHNPPHDAWHARHLALVLGLAEPGAAARLTPDQTPRGPGFGRPGAICFPGPPKPKPHGSAATSRGGLTDGAEGPTDRGGVRVARARACARARVGRAAGRRLDAGRGVPGARRRRAGRAARERRAVRTVGPVLVRRRRPGGGGHGRRGRGSRRAPSRASCRCRGPHGPGPCCRRCRSWRRRWRLRIRRSCRP